MDEQKQQLFSSSENGETEWLSSRDGTQHFLRFWQAENRRAFLVYLHGIEGHSLWFKDTASYLRKHGICTLALDRRGSGMSKEARGDMKCFGQLLDDISETITYARKQAAGLPVFLMANCWGAKLASLLVESQKPQSRDLAGVIFSSPAIAVKADLALSDKLKVLWRFLQNSPEPLAIPLALSDFTDNPLYLDFIDNDRLRLKEASARFFVNTFILTLLSKASAARITMPALLLQSGVDNIVRVDGIRAWFEKIKSEDKSFHLFKEVHHSLDFDRAPQEYRQILLDWILQRSAPLKANAEAPGELMAQTPAASAAEPQSKSIGNAYGALPGEQGQ